MKCENKFYTKLGSISIRAITEAVDKELLSFFSAKEIREILIQSLK